MSHYRFVDDYYAILDELRGSGDMGIDTEFLREKTFLAQLCLLQISTGDGIFCIDPLKQHDFDALWEVLVQRRWVLHAGRQDIEVIYQASDRMPRQIFDTQVAAALLGHAPQLGYANLVKALFDVELPKSHTRADWSKRPLASELLEYAADDVVYLLPALDTLSEQLDSKGRLDWAIEDSMALLDRELYDIHPEDAIHRIKGARNLKGGRRAVAAALAAWRETEALQRNRPRQWIFRDNTLIDLACRQPESVKAMRGIDGMPQGLISRAGERLLDIIREAANNPSAYQPPLPPDAEQKALIRKLQSVVNRIASELDIPAEVLAPRKELAAAVMAGERSSRLFSGWRADVVGSAVSAALGEG